MGPIGRKPLAAGFALALAMLAPAAPAEAGIAAGDRRSAASASGGLPLSARQRRQANDLAWLSFGGFFGGILDRGDACVMILPPGGRVAALPSPFRRGRPRG